MLETWPDFIRGLTVLLCTAVFGGLLHRLLGRWTVSFLLAKLLVSLFAILELIIAIGTARRAQLGGPLNETLYVIDVHCVAVLVVIAFWPRLMRGVRVGA